MLRVISLGAGVQSSTMYLLACAGALGEKPQLAIFADTQDEPAWVYDQLTQLESIGSIPIVRATAGKLSDEVIRSIKETPSAFVPIPTYIAGENGQERQGRRQCTRSHKTEVVAREIRRHLAKAERAELWIGISIDEAHRAKPSRYPRIDNRWPLLFDRPMRRGDCIEWMMEHGLERPRKSSCVYCPFRSDVDWKELKAFAPTEFERAVLFEKRMRALKPSNFIHNSCRPLDEIDFSIDTSQPDLFGNECEGMCGV